MHLGQQGNPSVLLFAESGNIHMPVGPKHSELFTYTLIRSIYMQPPWARSSINLDDSLTHQPF